MDPNSLPGPPSLVGEYLRSHLQEITKDWERAVLSDLKELANLDRGALIDHLPEVVSGLANWVEGRTRDAESSFMAMADGHALQRLGFGIELAAVNIEYSWLRRVILDHLQALPCTREVWSQVASLNEGLDRAIHLSVRRYTQHRDYIRDRFIGILGHDLRNPLTAIRVTAQGLHRSPDLSPRGKAQVETIETAVNRMDRMIGDVLDFARGHLGGGIPADPTACDVGEIVRNAVAEAKAAHPARSIQTKLEGDLRGTFDRDRVLQALGNLISNAVQYGEDPIEVSARETDDQRAIETTVSNRGKAIPAGVLPKLFNPFIHLVDEKKGTLGLGLFIASQINRAHGGTYDVTSNGQFTSFTFRWPRASRKDFPDRP